MLANLEGSTLVKRLKAASARNTRSSSELSDQLDDSVRPGTSPGWPETDSEKRSDELQPARAERAARMFRTSWTTCRPTSNAGNSWRSNGAGRHANARRDRQPAKTVGDDLPKDHGLSISQCEYWSDVLDRWAEDLVEAGKVAACNWPLASQPAAGHRAGSAADSGRRSQPCVKTPASPSRPKRRWSSRSHTEKADKLSETQKELADRVSQGDRPNSRIARRRKGICARKSACWRGRQVMDEATGILAKPDTGSPAIAAETEAIELLLKSKRINPKAAVAAVPTPAAAVVATPMTAALTLSVRGVNQKEVREDRGITQATGQSGPVLPEEFRAGLNEYFNRLDGGK